MADAGIMMAAGQLARWPRLQPGETRLMDEDQLAILPGNFFLAG